MTKQEIIEQINDTFDSLLINQPLTKTQMIDKINDTFDKLLIKM